MNDRINITWTLPFIGPFVVLGLARAVWWTAGAAWTQDTAEGMAAVGLFFGVLIGVVVALVIASDEEKVAQAKADAEGPRNPPTTGKSSFK